jgi:phasin family protein
VQGPLDQIAALNKIGFSAALDAAGVLATGATKLGELQLEAAKVLLQETVATVRTLAAARSFEDLTPKATAAAASGVEKTLGYSRNVYDITAATSVQLFELASTTASEMRKGFGIALEEIAGSIAMGSNTATTSALKSMLSTSEAVIEGLTKTATQSMQMADAAIKNAAAAAAKATKAAA